MTTASDLSFIETEDTSSQGEQERLTLLQRVRRWFRAQFPGRVPYHARDRARSQRRPLVLFDPRRHAVY